MKHFRRGILVAGLVFVLQGLSAQKYSNEFLAIGVGARAHGMAGAVAANVTDLSAAFWNPAALTTITAPSQFTAMHAEWFAGIAQYDYAAFGKQFNAEKSAYGSISLIRMGIDQIPYTLNLVAPDGSINYDNISEFSAADYAGIVSYGQRIGQSNWYVGGSVKIIHRSIGSFAKAWGFGLDAGILYNKDRFRFAVMGKDLSSTFNAWNFNLTEEEKLIFQQTGNVIPKSTLEQTLPRFIVGVSYRLPIGAKAGVLGEIDLDFTTDGQRNVLINGAFLNIDPRAGVEFDYDQVVFLRAGVNNIQEIRDDLNPGETNLSIQPNMGIGLKLGRVRLDYALTNIGNLSDAVLYSHIFALVLDFKRKQQ